MRWPPSAWALALALALASCRETGTHDAPAPSAAPSAPVAPAPPRVADLRSAEDRRDASAIVESDLTSPLVAVRRAAALALARIASDETRAPLLRLLSDEDEQVLALAAYGLGWSCRGHEDDHVKALVARSVSLTSLVAGSARPAPSSSARPDASRADSGALDPGTALARALGRCATDDAEAVLVGWLRGARASAAALALGDIAGRRRLREESTVALTQAAASGLGEALYPFGRADAPGSAVASRVREVAAGRLSVDDPTRIFAIRALGRTEDAAADDLGKVLTGSFRDAERAEAARALGRLGERGQQALGAALPTLAPASGPEGLAALVSDGFGPLTAALDTMTAPAPKASRAALGELAKLPLPDKDAPAAIRRRVARLRCRAARLLVTQPDEALLSGCDDGVERDLARLSVLGRDPIKGARRLPLFRSVLASSDAHVRGEAFEVLGQHREVDAAPLLVAGLKSTHGGTVASAARALAARAEPATPDVDRALQAALERPWKPDDTEIVGALLRAAGVERLASARPFLEKNCTSFSPTLRAQAAGALSLLGDRDKKCLSAPAAASPAPELGHPPGPARLILDTDVGELTLQLDPTWAPVAAARLLDLASSGFFDAMAVHRVVPGFVVQFGDRAGDGTGAAGREPLRCETAPVPFAPLSVGVALDGRDTGSSQFFVTLARTPHLDGDYARVGTASGDWAAVAEGDVIRKVRVAPLPDGDLPHPLPDAAGRGV